MSIFNKLFGSQNNEAVQCAVEYCAPHWIVVIRNPGEKAWTPLRSLTKKIRIMDEFGNEKASRPAIESFTSKGSAEEWVKDNMPGCSSVQRSAQQRKEDHAWFGGTSSVSTSVSVPQRFGTTANS